MVERPIKKSERQQKAETNAAEGKPESQSSDSQRAPRNRDRDGSRDGGRDNREGGRNRDRDGKRGKGKGKGKGERFEAEKPPVNLALMRGPKPSQAKSPVEEPPVEAPPAKSIESGETADTVVEAGDRDNQAVDMEAAISTEADTPVQETTTPADAVIEDMVADAASTETVTEPTSDIEPQAAETAPAEIASAAPIIEPVAAAPEEGSHEEEKPDEAEAPAEKVVEAAAPTPAEAIVTAEEKAVES